MLTVRRDPPALAHNQTSYRWLSATSPPPERVASDLSRDHERCRHVELGAGLPYMDLPAPSRLAHRASVCPRFCPLSNPATKGFKGGETVDKQIALESCITSQARSRTYLLLRVSQTLRTKPGFAECLWEYNAFLGKGSHRVGPTWSKNSDSDCARDRKSVV